MDFIIRSFQAEDAEAVKEVALRSWEYTYYQQKPIFTPEQIRRFNENWYSIKGLRSIPKQVEAGLTKFSVVEDSENKSIAGFAQIGYQSTNFSGETKSPLLLYRIYIDPKYTRNGLGSQLIEDMEEFVRRKNRHYYLLYVHKENKIGISFYNKLGFEHWREKDTADEFCFGRVMVY